MGFENVIQILIAEIVSTMVTYAHKFTRIILQCHHILRRIVAQTHRNGVAILDTDFHSAIAELLCISERCLPTRNGVPGNAYK